MANTKVIAEETRQIIRDGVDLIGDTVGATMGAKGRYVLVNQNGRDSHATKDGVSVSTAIRPKDNRIAAVVKAIQNAAVKTVVVAGDGTTSATVLTQDLVNHGLDLIENGSNPIDVKRGMESAKEDVLEELAKISREVDYGDEMLLHVATVSANNDAEIGQLVFEATNKVTKEGVIRVEDSMTNDTVIEVKDAFEIESGWISPALATNPRMESNYDNPLILISGENISNFKDVEPAIRLSMELKRPLVIVADGFSGDVPATIISNVAQSKLHINLVKAVGTGSIKTDFLVDLAVLTGATVISNNMGNSLKDVSPTDFGSAEKVISTKNSTVIEGANGYEELILERINYIKEEAKSIKNDNDRIRLERRAGKLLGKVAIIKVGGGTELERKEIIDRVDDSLRATKSALSEGVVAGGGVALIKTVERMRNEGIITDNSDYMLGYIVLLESLSTPIRRMVQNAGLNAEEVIKKVLNNDSDSYGYNLQSEEYGDMFEAGIVDPKQVVRVAVESAVSVAGILITTERIIVDEE